MNIRPVHNADLPALVKIWQEHWSAVGPPPEVNAARFEQAILARTFFDPSTLLVAEDDQGLHAWAHYQPDLSSATTAVLCAVCWNDRTDLATELLTQTSQQIQAKGFQSIQVGVAQDDQFGYAGLDPVGHGIGVPVTDARLTGLVSQLGFLPEQQFVRLQVSVAGYRPPVSRDALQLRRSSRIETERHQHADTRVAAGMSHLDIETHVLLDRSGSELARVNLWFSDAEAEVMSPAKVILDLDSTESVEPARAYLISAVIQASGQHRVSHFETVVNQQHEALAQLTNLHFRPIEEGVVYQKALHD